MRIISKFHDYYDVVMRQGFDQTIVYPREQKEILLPQETNYPFVENYSWRYRNKSGNMKLAYLGYCGQILPFITIDTNQWWSELTPNREDLNKNSHQTFFNSEIFKATALKEYPFIEWDKKEYERRWAYNNHFNGFYFENFLNKTHVLSLSDSYFNRTHSPESFKQLQPIFQTNNVPLFLYERINFSSDRRVLLNPCLKDINFQLQKDTYTTYQEIFQYVAGVLNQPEKKMVQISNEDKIEKHGFDEWSFRKPPSKK